MVRSKPQPSRHSMPKARIMVLGKKQYIIRAKLIKTIKKLQSTVEHCIPKKPFCSLIREILQEAENRREPFRIQMNALGALQEAAEMYVVGLFEDANLCAAHAKRITLRPADMQLALTLRGDKRFM